MKTPRSYFSQLLLAAGAGAMLILGSGGTNARGQGHQSMSESAHSNAWQQIQALMADKAQWTKTQQKLDTQLIFAARMKAKGFVHPAAPKLRPSLTNELDGRIKVDIKGNVTPELLAAIPAAGGKVISSLPDYHFIQAVLPVENMEAIAARDEVVFIKPAVKGHRNYVDSQGDTTHAAISARATYGVSGAGIKVGVLSDSIDNGSNALSAAIASGNIIATNTFVITGQAGSGSGEGLAMCEVIHDLAPQASIYFATSTTSEAQMAANIVALANAGCRIICDDDTYADESPFQDGVIAQAVNTVSAMGVLYLSAARNSGNLDSEMSSTWESEFISSNTVAGYGPELEFGTGVNAARVDDILEGGYDFEADLFWTDPLGASTNDYDLYMLSTSSGDIVYSSINAQNGTQDPYEHISDPAGYSYGYSLAVILSSGTTNRFLYLDFGRGVLYWGTSGSVRGHNACDAPNSLTIAATPAFTSNGVTAYGVDCPTGPYPNPFNTSDVVEFYSSDGPRRMFYNQDGSAITPGNFTSTGGKVFYKPDLTAADGVTCTPPGFAPFFGTSCATPHAAAIAALVMSYNPGLTAAQVCYILTNSCIDIMAAGWDRDSGSGILMANLALEHTPAASYFVKGTAKYTASGQFQVTVAGSSGSTYNIQVSTNLTTWSQLTTLAMSGTNTVFTDPHVSATRRFYRTGIAP